MQGLKRAYIVGNYTPPAPGPPRDYYIAIGGTGDGLTSGAPAPLSTLTSALIVSNDNIFFNRGDTFELSDFLLGGVNDINVGAFGSGADPILIGSVSLTAAVWTDNGDGTWWTSLADAPKWVWINGVHARLAESPWYQIDAAPNVGTRSIAAATLAGLSSILTAKAIFKQTDYWASPLVTIATQDNTTGNFTFSPSFADNSYAKVGLSVKFLNQAQFLTTAGDWWYDEVNEKLFVKSVATPAGTDIRITQGDFGFLIINSDRITFDNLELKHYYKSGFEANNCDDLSITNCTLNDIRGNGVRIYGSSTDFVFEDNDLNRISLNGVGLQIVGVSIKRNDFTDIGVQSNPGYPFDSNLGGGIGIGILGVCSDAEIDQNTFTNHGYSPIRWLGINFSITRNYINNFGLEWNDGGGIYTIYRLGLGPGTYNGLIQKNIVTNGYGNVTGTSQLVVFEGIYIDNGCNDITIDDNSVYLIGDAGIILNWDCKENTVTNNRVAACNNYQLFIREDTDIADSPVFQFNVGNVVTGNILAARTTLGVCVDATNLNGSTTYNPFSSGGNSDGNHYVYPYNNFVNSYHNGQGAIFRTNYDLPGWQTKMGMDGTSTQRINYIVFSTTNNAAQEVKMELNPTAAAVNFNVPAGYSDYAGNAFSNPVSIPAYGSLMYFKNTAFP